VHSILQSQPQIPRRDGDGDEGRASDDIVSLIVAISINHDSISISISISTVITVSLRKRSDSSLPPRFFLTLFSPPLLFTSLHYTILSHSIQSNPSYPIHSYAILSYAMSSHPILSYPMLCHLMSSHVMSSHLMSCHLISCHLINHRHYEFGFDNFLNSDTRDGFPTRTLSAMASAVLKSCLNCSLSVRILFVYVFNICDFFLPSAALMAKSSRRNK
jgi:hypothetical protein